MPTTIPEGFKKLKSNLEITTLQAAVASTRQKNVRDAVAADMAVIDDFLTGSYRRSTMIAPLKEADIDIFVVLQASYWKEDNQESLLDKVRDVLKKTYPRTPKISRDGQAVSITFTDFIVDVVPAFNRKGGGYLIPDSIKKKWISTDPTQHITIWSEANKAHNNDLVPLIKMIKGWNKKHSQLLRSFHLESTVLKILDGVRIDDYPSGVRYVFDKARTVAISEVLDPAGYGSNTGAYLDTQGKRDAVVNILETAYKRAKSAEELASAGKIADAYSKWQLIFGDYFPSYG